MKFLQDLYSFIVTLVLTSNLVLIELLLLWLVLLL